MPQINLTVSGETNASASGNVTDPAVLAHIRAVLDHLQDRAHADQPTAGSPTS